VEGGAVRLDTAGTRALAEAEPRVVAHMNEDHADAVALYAERLLGRAGGGGWRMTGIDPEGIDLRRGAEVARLPFDAPVRDAGAARAELVRLVGRARERAEGTA
jgi:heme iron utilization protein